MATAVGERVSGKVEASERVDSTEAREAEAVTKGTVTADRDEYGRFVPGTSVRGGRKEGTRDGATLLKMALEALDRAGGVEYLATAAQTHKGSFLQFISKILPRESRLTGGITIEQAIARIAGVELGSEDSLPRAAQPILPAPNGNNHRDSAPESTLEPQEGV